MLKNQSSREATIVDLQKQVDRFANDLKKGNDLLHERDLESKKLGEEINYRNSRYLAMQDELSTLKSNQVTLTAKIIQLEYNAIKQ
jgi:hypothetical protein